MYKCIKCNKQFRYESDFIRHKNRKTACNVIKQNLDCELCKVKFKCKAEKIRHEQTKKHIFNIKNSTINNSFNHSFNNIINLTLNVNSFKNTDTSHIRNAIIQEIGDFIYLETINKKYTPDTEKVKILFDSVIKMLESLHFNLEIEENHNLKILLIFPGIKKKVYEYLILEINPETKQIVWNSLSYEEILEKIFHHLYTLNNKLQNENYDKFILFLKKYLIYDKELSQELKPCIQHKLSEMYVNFNKKQKKDERDIKPDIKEKIQEYVFYRNQECKLPNGFNPEIQNSDIINS
jgi:hypothetical protein